jgi:hypothetical protein
MTCDLGLDHPKVRFALALAMGAWFVKRDTKRATPSPIGVEVAFTNDSRKWA